MTNSDIAELLAGEAESAKPPLQKALRRAARRAFLWPEEAEQLLLEGRSLTELSGIGPYLDKRIRQWVANHSPVPPAPDLRRDFITVPQARSVMRANPSWAAEVKGDLQTHTEWSDGTGSIQEMGDAADERGYEYIAITDHSKGLKIAGGITEEQLEKQEAEIDAINRAQQNNHRRVRALRSIELNLNPQGEGDMEPGALARLEIVLGCFHSALRKKEDQTERYLAALRNPAIQILGHPRGRIYNYRLGLHAEWPRVFDLAAELDKAVEIDAYPDRQDLNVDLIRLAGKSGCRISLGTDAHGPSQLRFMELGLAAALLAGIPRERILNFLPRDALLAWVEIVRERARRN